MLWSRLAGLALGVTASWAALTCAWPAKGQATSAELAVVGGSGVLGGTVAVTIQLSGEDSDTAVSADLDVRFPADLVDLIPPVAQRCRVAARLAATHQVGGTVPEVGLLRFSVFDVTALDPLGNGELATCDFRILPTATRSSAELTPEFVELRGGEGDVPAVAVGGSIVITDVTPGPAAQCTGDCDGNATVTIDELIRGVGISLGNLPLTECGVFDASGDGAVSISELITGVNHTLHGC